jgi:hypothetical protein
MKIVKHTAIACDFCRKSRRKDAEVNPLGGPGEQEEHRNFGYDTLAHTVREKRESSIPITVGPGEYAHEQADTHTKYRHPSYDF